MTIRNLSRRLLAVSVLLIGLVATRSVSAGWMPVEGPYLSQDGYQIDIPLGWMLRTPIDDELLLTRDGVGLQYVRVGRSRLADALRSQSSKLTPRTDPLEAAEIIANDFRADANLVNFQIAAALPAQIDGHAAFQLLLHYSTKEKMRKSGMFYGVIHEDSMYFIHYDAPSRHYFERYRSTIERMKDSFKINP